MNVAELALHHQRLSQQATHLRGAVQRVEARLASDPEVLRLEEEVQLARQERRALELRVRQSEQEVEVRRQRMQYRQRELMSGRIKNPTELMKLSAEVARLRAGMSEAEDAELVLLEDAEQQDDRLLELERKLEQARAVVKAAQPSLELQLEGDRSRLQQLEAEREEVWGRLPDTWQTQYQRVQARTSDPVAEVVGAQCQGCHVGVTTSGMQTLRRGGMIRCDNCGRLLVVT
jgi:uncharacterized protein